MASMPKGEPRSVPDDLAGPWNESIRLNRILQAKNDPLAVHLAGSDLAKGGEIVKRALDGVASRARKVVGDAVYAIHGQNPEEPSSSNPVARWSESKVGRDGYNRIEPAKDARGKHNDILAVAGLRGVGDPKCNQFVWDALQAGGAPADRMADGHIPVAREWGDPRSTIGGYEPVKGSPQPGDVISNGEHVAIFAPLPDGRPGTVSAASPTTHDAGWMGGVVHNDWGFRGDEGQMTVWRAKPRPRRTP